jgi:hypothetical protein
LGEGRRRPQRGGEQGEYQEQTAHHPPY